MKNNIVKVGNVNIGAKASFTLIAGPCVIESKSSCIKIAKSLKSIAKRVGISFVFKASYDKANRSSIQSYRGPGIEKGLEILKEIKEVLGVPVLSDVHSVEEVDQAAKVLDIIQIPAFLSRQTDLVVKVAQTKKVVNIKKGQFMAPWDMAQVVKKAQSTGNRKILLTERGVSFGYNNLVTDFRAIQIMKEMGCPVIFDVTHSVQQPGGLGHASGGQSQFVPLLARCGIVAGSDALFMEAHPTPKKALSDGPNSWPLNKCEKLLVELLKLHKAVKK